MKRLKLKWFLVVVVLFLAVICWVGIKAHSEKQMKKFQGCVYSSYTVKVGDTLWDIAEDVNKFNVTTSEYVSQLRKVNDLHTDMIRVGETLVIILPGM